MYNKNKKVTKMSKSRQPNIGLIIFSVIFLYILINIILYFNKDHLSLYEVVEGKNADNNICKGVIIRDETIEYTTRAGYLNYYIKEGERIAKNATAYTIDESGTVYEQLKNTENENILSEDDITKFRSDIKSFKKTFSDDNFNSVYNFKYDVENSILEIKNYNMLNNLDAILSDESKASFHIEKANHSGIVSYSVDNMENLKEEDVTVATFDTTDFIRTQLRTTDLFDKNSPVYKLVTSENWSVIILLTKEQYDKIYENNKIKITFIKDGLTTSANLTCYQKGDTYFAKLDFDKYMIRYLGDRFLDIELSINSAKGLKIPITSIVEKEFYKIPLDCFTVGGNSNNVGIIKESYSENGKVDYIFIATDVYFEDEEYGYIDSNLLNPDDWIRITNSKDRYQVQLTDNLLGVYNINKGYAVFRRIEKIYENEEYCIIKKDTPLGLSVYDHIALKGTTVVEQAIIY